LSVFWSAHTDNLSVIRRPQYRQFVGANTDNLSRGRPFRLGLRLDRAIGPEAANTDNLSVYGKVLLSDPQAGIMLASGRLGGH
jgi:hypothetical protein